MWISSLDHGRESYSMENFVYFGFYLGLFFFLLCLCIFPLKAMS